MSSFSRSSYKVFTRSIADWHLQFADKSDPWNCFCAEPDELDAWSKLLYRKNQIDCSQWHTEDEIRRDDIPDKAIVHMKRKIDKLNQERTDLVEKLEDSLAIRFSDCKPKADARVNTETPGWALDRLSILALKIWHVDEQSKRDDVDPAVRIRHGQKLEVLQRQLDDLCVSLDQLLEEIHGGSCRFTLYRQMKLYNDPATNPALYKNREP